MHQQQVQHEENLKNKVAKKHQAEHSIKQSLQVLQEKFEKEKAVIERDGAAKLATMQAEIDAIQETFKTKQQEFQAKVAEAVCEEEHQPGKFGGPACGAGG